MAEYLFRDLCEKSRLNIEVISRGAIGLPSSSQLQMCHNGFSYFVMGEVVESLRDYNPNIKWVEQHISTNYTNRCIESSDLILTMEAHIRDKILSFNWVKQDLTRKVFTLKEYAGFFEDPDIGDPALLENRKLIEQGGFEDLFVKDANGELKLDPIKQNEFYRRLWQKSYNLCRDEILMCLHLILEGKEASYETIIKNRIPAIELAKRKFKNGN